ncbi:regulator of G-protein signaling 9-binding protein [Stigmatopora argus]
MRMRMRTRTKTRRTLFKKQWLQVQDKVNSSVVMSENGAEDAPDISRFQTLVRVTCTFRQLASSLGSSADSHLLRQEMERHGTRARLLCDGLSQRLPRLLGEASPEERPALERLCAHFLSALENLVCDLRKAHGLAALFPLGRPHDRRALVNTGRVEGATGSTDAASPRASPSAGDPREAGLGEHLRALEDVLSDMHLRVPVAWWCVESTQPPFPPPSVDDEDGDNPEDDGDETPVAVATGEACCCWPACGGRTSPLSFI